MTEWYRNKDWNEDIEEMFFDKLSRARSQRDQYIVIQALSLAESKPDVALKLIDHYWETRTDDFHDDRARLAVSNAQFASGGYEKALDNYLAILEGEDGERDLYVGSPIRFAFLAARYRSAKHYQSALDQLESVSVPGPEMIDAHFTYHAAIALILAETGTDPARSLSSARSALSLPQEYIEQFLDVVWRLRGITRS